MSGPRGGWIPEEESLVEGGLDADEIRRRAMGGSVTLAARGIAIRLLAFGGSLVLARLLAPSDFGVIAFGSSLLTIGAFLGAAGIGGALIGRSEPPTRRELESLLALQLTGTTAFAGAMAAVGWQFGETGQVVALMAASIPLLAYRAPAAITFERKLEYRPLVAVELLEALVFYSYAVVTVAVGWGVWGFASAYVVRAAAGTVMMLRLTPVRVLRPRPSLSAVRGLLGFGVRFEAVGVVRIVTEQLLNVGTVAIAGVATLGLWSVARRVLDVPTVFFESLWRVGFPAMSRLLAVGEDPRPLIERGVARAAVITGVILVALVGAGPPLVPVVFGERWGEIANVIPLACIGIMLGGPVSVATAGYIYALGHASTILRSGILMNLAFLGTTFLLLPGLGVTAFGAGMIAASVVDSLVLGRAANKHSQARVASHLAIPFVLAALAGSAAWLSARTLESAIGSAITGLAVGEALLVGLLSALNRTLLADSLDFIRRAISVSVRPSS